MIERDIDQVGGWNDPADPRPRRQRNAIAGPRGQVAMSQQVWDGRTDLGVVTGLECLPGMRTLLI